MSAYASSKSTLHFPPLTRTTNNTWLLSASRYSSSLESWRYINRRRWTTLKVFLGHHLHRRGRHSETFDCLYLSRLESSSSRTKPLSRFTTALEEVDSTTEPLCTTRTSRPRVPIIRVPWRTGDTTHRVQSPRCLSRLALPLPLRDHVRVL